MLEHMGAHKPAPPEAGLSHKTTNWPGFKLRFFLRNKQNRFPPVAGLASGVKVFLLGAPKCTSNAGRSRPEHSKPVAVCISRDGTHAPNREVSAARGRRFLQDPEAIRAHCDISLPLRTPGVQP